MYGTGIISVIGTSFTFLNVTQQSINNMMVSAQPLCQQPIQTASWIAPAASGHRCMTPLWDFGPAQPQSVHCASCGSFNDCARHACMQHHRICLQAAASSCSLQTEITRPAMSAFDSLLLSGARPKLQAIICSCGSCS